MVLTELFSYHMRTHEKPIALQNAVKAELYYPKREWTEKSLKHICKYGMKDKKTIWNETPINLTLKWNNHIKGKGDYNCFTSKNRNHKDMEFLWVNPSNFFKNKYRIRSMIYNKCDATIGNHKWYGINTTIEGLEGKDILLSCLTDKVYAGDNVMFDTKQNRDLIWNWIMKI